MASAIVGLIAVLALVSLAIFGCSSELTVIVDNQSGVGIPPTTLTAGSQVVANVPAVAAGSKVSVRPVLPDYAEYRLLWVHPGGRSYFLLPYTENNPGGEVEVTVVAQNGGVMVGRVDDRSDYSHEGQSALETFQ